MPARALLFANGLLADIAAARRIPRPGDVILAADGGTLNALALGLIPETVLGDLDSLPVDIQEQLVQAGAHFIQHPADKNETDLELALHHAVARGFTEIVMVGALGGRLDQTLGNLSMLTDPRLAGVDVRLDDGVEQAFFVRASCQVAGNPGDTISLIPWGGAVTVTATTGLRWALADEILQPCRTRGISNKMLGTSAAVTITSGLLLLVHRHRQEEE